MRVFDVYEHPSFDIEEAGSTQTAVFRLGLGAVSALVAAGFWRYYWSDKSPPPSSSSLPCC
ncbi:hypothetical protein BV25DRAFT_1820097 [Artomyces pyxidatus]|uniref:Uncharacterized protein n=1 Tax=Artomyces pyxidatus TaxID=48021 RepID=A0ACB8TEV5_9AGAM|nr:hypothetical protein BV25DRAFT_1820097 [Artomyces pyxidatus]